MRSAAIISDLEKRIERYEANSRMGSGPRDRERPATTSAYFTDEAAGPVAELNFKRPREYASEMAEGSRYSRQSSGSTTGVSSLSSSPIAIQPIQYFNNNQSVRESGTGQHQQDRPQSSYSVRSASTAYGAQSPARAGFPEARLSPQQIASLSEHKPASGINVRAHPPLLFLTILRACHALPIFTTNCVSQRSAGSAPTRPSTTGPSTSTSPAALGSRLRSPYQALINRPGSIVSSSQTQQQYTLAQRLQLPLEGPAAYPMWTARGSP